MATALYAATAAMHVFQMIRYRSWYLSVLVLAGLSTSPPSSLTVHRLPTNPHTVEAFGYFSRVLSDNNVYSRYAPPSLTLILIHR